MNVTEEIKSKRKNLREKKRREERKRKKKKKKKKGKKKERTLTAVTLKNHFLPVSAGFSVLRYNIGYLTKLTTSISLKLSTALQQV